MATRHIQAARADGQHADAAAGRGVAVRADQGLARHAEALQMHLMADAVAGTGKIHAVLFGTRSGYSGGRPRFRSRSAGYCGRYRRRERSVFTRGTPMASNSRYAIVPVASCVSVWSILRPISCPTTISPSTRCAFKIFCAIVIPMCTIAPFCPDAARNLALRPALSSQGSRCGFHSLLHDAPRRTVPKSLI